MAQEKSDKKFDTYTEKELKKESKEAIISLYLQMQQNKQSLEKNLALANHRLIEKEQKLLEFQKSESFNYIKSTFPDLIQSQENASEQTEEKSQ